MLITILVTYVICRSITATYIEFNDIQPNGDLYCYEYHQVSASPFDAVVIYPFAPCAEERSNDEMYTVLSNILHNDSNIDIITDHQGIGIQITNTDDYSRHEIIVFCFFRQVAVISDGEYCILTNKQHKHHHHHKNCHHHLLVPDICSFVPTIEPTFNPTFEALPEEFGEVLIPGENYTFPGGWFSINNESVIIRPHMIHDCSLRNNTVDVYEDEIDRANLTETVQIGHPLFSLLIDINDMPVECPILFGLINNISNHTSDINILHIELVELDPSLIFLNSDINITNASVFELHTLGDMSVEDTFSIIDPLINETFDEFENITVVEDAVIIHNDADFNFTDYSVLSDRRRLLTFRRSGSVSLGIRLVFSPIPQLEVTVGFRLHGGVSLLLQTSWLSIVRFRFEVEIGAVFGISAKLTAKHAKNQRFNIRPAAIRSNHILPIFGIPVLITGFHKLDISLEIEASVSAGCSFEYTPGFKGGFDCTPERGCESIKRSPVPPNKNGCKLISYDKCQLSGAIFAHPQFGVTLYHGLFTIVHPVKAGPRLSVTYPSSDDIPCACPDFFELAVDLVVGIEVQLKLLDIKALRKFKKLRSILKHLSIKIFQFDAVIEGVAICLDISILPDSIADLLETKCCQSKAPTNNPTTAPTLPMPAPTFSPTSAPTVPPSAAPTYSPSAAPSSAPTYSPTAAPAPIPAPTLPPTLDPTIEPTVKPSDAPTIEPTIDPTAPTLEPTVIPSLSPTLEPTVDPTTNPTLSPTTDPTQEPTIDPTMSPTLEPTINPTMSPTLEPTIHPTVSPTIPTLEPTLSPTTKEPPTLEPTNDPTSDPSNDPTSDPIKDPTSDTTSDPTKDPTSDPTKDPTSNPTKDPTSDPTKDPTSDPTKDPTSDPTKDPTSDPTKDPTTNTTTDPTSDPTSDPSNDPTRDPTKDPTADPAHSPIFDAKVVQNGSMFGGSYGKPLEYFQDESPMKVGELKIDIFLIVVSVFTAVTSSIMCLVFVLCKNKLKFYYV